MKQGFGQSDARETARQLAPSISCLQSCPAIVSWIPVRREVQKKRRYPGRPIAQLANFHFRLGSVREKKERQGRRQRMRQTRFVSLVDDMSRQLTAPAAKLSAL